MIYLNNAATTLQKPPCVIEAVVEAMNGQGSCARGSHASELTAARTVFHTREALARLFAFPYPERVVFTANATQALNTALWGLLKPGDHVIATDWDHNSVLRPLHALAQAKEVKVDYLSADRQGRLEYDQLDGLLRPNTRLLVGTHASNLTGNLLDVERMAAFAKKHGLVFLLDAAQTAGSTPIAMEEMGVHLLAFTGHKGLMGPQGTGGLWDIPGVTVYGDFSGDRAPVVALNLEGWDPAAAADELSQGYDIAVRPGIHCAPRMHRALGTQDTGCLRFSFGWYTTQEDINAALAALKEMAQ